MGVNYFVDSANGDDTDDGTTMDNGPGGGTGAWATIEHAHEAGGLSAGDIVWVRRTHIEYAGNPTSDIACAYDGTAAEPIKTIGWPRAEIPNTTITSATWTNGSTTVDLIVGITCDRTEHQTRFATAPDGEKYLITKITDANTLIIDREYAGSTVTGVSGKFSIDEDEDYATAQAIDDSAFTIKVADWTADDDSMPCIDFKNQAYQLTMTSDDYHHFKNLEFRDSVDNMMIDVNTGDGIVFHGCLLYNDNAKGIIAANGSHLLLSRTIVESDGTNTYGVQVDSSGSTVSLKDVAIYLMGTNAIRMLSGAGKVYMENVNLGVEGVCGAADISVSASLIGYGRDVLFGAAVAEISTLNITYPNIFRVENYNKVLGVHKTFMFQGDLLSVTAGAGGDVPNQRSGGNATLLEVDFDVAAYDGLDMDNTMPVFTAEFDATTDSKDYRIYLQNMAEIAASKLKLVCEYTSSYDDATEYVITKTEGTASNSPIPARADADDWDEYIEVTGIQPAVASKVRILLYTDFYHATDQWYVDPLVVVSDT